MANYKDESRRLWIRTDGENPTLEQLQLGCMQRIADASEAMAKDHVRLLNDAKWQREAKERLQKTCDRLARSNAALRGYIKRMKRANG